MSSNRYEQDSRHRQNEKAKSSEVLRPLSLDVVPIINTPEFPTLQRFLNNILNQTADQLSALKRGDIALDEVQRDVVFFVGMPGSGKSYSMQKFDEAIKKRKIPEPLVNKVAWEDADIKHTSDKQKRYKARPLSSPEEMYEANVRSLKQFDSKKDWVLARGEYAPIVLRNKITNTWQGRDGGATAIEHILHTTPNIRPYVVGIAPEWRLNEFTNAAREVGAYGNQVFLYEQYAIAFAQHLRNQGDLGKLPDYLSDYLFDIERSTPLEFDDFPEAIYKMIQPNAKLFATSDEMQQRLKEIRQTRGERDSKRQLTYEARVNIAQRDCAAISSLYLMNHLFTQEFGIPEDNIFMGIMAPPIERFKNSNSLTMTNYMKEYSLYDLMEQDEE